MRSRVVSFGLGAAYIVLIASFGPYGADARAADLAPDRPQAAATTRPATQPTAPAAACCAMSFATANNACPAMPGKAPTGRGMVGGQGMGMRGDGPAIHALLAAHDKVKRTVEDVPKGIRSVTTSDDAQVAAQIRRHVWRMKDRIEKGEIIRPMDPLFQEVFSHHQEIKMRIEDVPGGVRVTETSDNPQVVLLIRQHAYRAVNEFVESGMPRMHEPTPLPEGYRK